MGIPKAKIYSRHTRLFILISVILSNLCAVSSYRIYGGEDQQISYLSLASEDASEFAEQKRLTRVPIEPIEDGNALPIYYTFMNLFQNSSVEDNKELLKEYYEDVKKTMMEALDSKGQRKNLKKAMEIVRKLNLLLKMAYNEVGDVSECTNKLYEFAKNIIQLLIDPHTWVINRVQNVLNTTVEMPSKRIERNDADNRGDVPYELEMEQGDETILQNKFTRSSVHGNDKRNVKKPKKSKLRQSGKKMASNKCLDLDENIINCINNSTMNTDDRKKLNLLLKEVADVLMSVEEIKEALNDMNYLIADKEGASKHSKDGTNCALPIQITCLQGSKDDANSDGNSIRKVSNKASRKMHGKESKHPLKTGDKSDNEDSDDTNVSYDDDSDVNSSSDDDDSGTNSSDDDDDVAGKKSSDSEDSESSDGNDDSEGDDGPHTDLNQNEDNDDESDSNDNDDDDSNSENSDDEDSSISDDNPPPTKSFSTLVLSDQLTSEEIQKIPQVTEYDSLLDDNKPGVEDSDSSDDSSSNNGDSDDDDSLDSDVGKKSKNRKSKNKHPEYRNYKNDNAIFDVDDDNEKLSLVCSQQPSMETSILLHENAPSGRKKSKTLDHLQQTLANLKSILNNRQPKLKAEADMILNFAKEVCEEKCRSKNEKSLVINSPIEIDTDGLLIKLKPKGESKVNPGALNPGKHSNYDRHHKKPMDHDRDSSTGKHGKSKDPCCLKELSKVLEKLSPDCEYLDDVDLRKRRSSDLKQLEVDVKNNSKSMEETFTPAKSNKFAKKYQCSYKGSSDSKHQELGNKGQIKPRVTRSNNFVKILEKLNLKEGGPAVNVTSILNPDNDLARPLNVSLKLTKDGVTSHVGSEAKEGDFVSVKIDDSMNLLGEVTGNNTILFSSIFEFNELVEGLLKNIYVWDFPNIKITNEALKDPVINLLVNRTQTD